jgi:hypothetical protein
MLEKLFDEMISAQRDKLLKYGQRILPHVTEEDLLQPNDFPQIENHPIFRYEEGVLAGLMAARMAYLRWKNLPENVQSRVQD